MGTNDTIPQKLTYYALIVMFICTLPHFTSAPWWLGLYIISIVGYRFIANYKHYPRVPAWKTLIMLVVILILLRLDYSQIISSQFFIGMLVSLFWLKAIEMRRIRDLRAITLINFYVIFTSLIVHSQLWIIVYMVIALSANLSLMIKLDAPNFGLRQLHIGMLKTLIIAIPMSLLLFFIFPRFSSPIWGIPMSPGKIGFGENMTPGSFSELFGDDSLAMRVTFNHKIDSAQYWNGLYLSHFDGNSWTFVSENDLEYIPLQPLKKTQKPDYEVILEPNSLKWVFFLNNPSSSTPDLLYNNSIGMILSNGKTITQRLAYGIKSQENKYKPLTKISRRQNLQYPTYTNYRLQKWALDLKNKTGANPQAVIAHIHYYIQQNNFWYRLSPKPTIQNFNQLDDFWFSTQEGYCEHYASAVAFILRAVGIPARVVMGYYGGEWNPIAKYLTVRQQNAHAWIEYWQEDYGWQRVDPTSFIPRERVDKTIRQFSESQNLPDVFNDWEVSRFKFLWFERARMSFNSAVFFWEHWLLFYSSDRQQSLMKKLGLDNWNWIQLSQLWIGCIILFMLAGILSHYIMQRKKVDPLIKTYHQLRNELNLLGVHTQSPSSITKELNMLADLHPNLKSTVKNFLKTYEELRYKLKNSNTLESRNETIILIKSLRKQLINYDIKINNS